MSGDVQADARRLREAIGDVLWRAATSGEHHGNHWYIVENGEAVAFVASQDGIDEDLRRPRAEFIAAAPALVDRLLAELDQAKTENERLVHPRPDEEHPIEIRHGWLVQAGQEPNFISGYGYEPDTDAAPLMQLSDLPGWPGAELDAARATIQRVRELAQRWQGALALGTPGEGPVPDDATRSFGDELARTLGGAS